MRSMRYVVLQAQIDTAVRNSYSRTEHKTDILTRQLTRPDIMRYIV